MKKDFCLVFFGSPSFVFRRKNWTKGAPISLSKPHHQMMYYKTPCMFDLRTTVHVCMYARLPYMHRLNMELDLQSLFGLLCTAVLIG